MAENFIERLAEEGKKQFKNIDIDKNGFLNILELKFAADQNQKNNVADILNAPSFLASKYNDVIDFQDDNIYLGKTADTKRNNYGLSLDDLQAMSLLSTGKKDDLIRKAGRYGAGVGAGLGGIAGISAFTFMTIGEVAGPLPVLAFIGAPIAGGIAGYIVEKSRAKNYFADKERIVKSYFLKSA
jgi:hypothetical protein